MVFVKKTTYYVDIIKNNEGDKTRYRYSLKNFEEIVEIIRPKYDPNKSIEENIGCKVTFSCKNAYCSYTNFEGILKSVYNDCRGKVVTIKSGLFEYNFRNDNTLILK